tara:strand:+ start:613 stop:735 length:123 start_codon:yes stop_codon:yes gene_type:complete
MIKINGNKNPKAKGIKHIRFERKAFLELVVEKFSILLLIL